MAYKKFVSLYMLSLLFFAHVFGQTNAKEQLSEEASALKHTILLNNAKAFIPLSNLEKIQIALVKNGIDAGKIMGEHLNHYMSVDILDALNQASKAHNLYVLLVDAEHVHDPAFRDDLFQFSKTHSSIVTVLGSSKELAALDGLSAPIVWVDAPSAVAAKVASEVIFGGLAVNNTLEETISTNFRKGDGFKTQVTRLSYSIPEAVGIDGAQLSAKIDAIAAEMIEGKGAPGAAVMVVKDNKVIFDRAYGTHTYEGNIPTKTTDLFDMASISKIASTTLAVMHLDETGKIDLNQTMGHYLKDAKKSNKKDVVLRDVMLHQAGFVPFIPFYRNLEPSDHSVDSSAAYPTKVAENYYLRKNYFQDVMWPEMLASPLKSSGDYVYSDISMYVMQQVIQTVTKKHLDTYVAQQFYAPLGMDNTLYNPWRFYDSKEIIPTEDDDSFRKSRLIGYVHDQGSGMAGGVAGHAGLFSTVDDLAKYAQMLLNGGEYGGVRYFEEATVNLYTSKQGTHSRRGLGFDRKDPDPKKAYPSALASASTFGHTGYTGTCIWIDPENQLTYIFLSNRVQPKVSTRIYEMNIRSRIQDAVYSALPK